MTKSNDLTGPIGRIEMEATRLDVGVVSRHGKTFRPVLFLAQDATGLTDCGCPKKSAIAAYLRALKKHDQPEE
jgi:hypothetical protein